MGNLEMTIDQAIIRGSRIVGLAGLLGLLLIALVTVAEGIGRSLFGMVSMGATDLFSVVLAVAIGACFPLVLAERRSITIRIAGNLVGPRGKALLESFGDLLTLGFFIIIAWQLWIYSGELFRDNVTTYQLQWRLFPWYYASTVFFTVCVPVQAFVLHDHLRQAFTLPREPGQEEKPAPREEG